MMNISGMFHFMYMCVYVYLHMHTCDRAGTLVTRTPTLVLIACGRCVSGEGGPRDYRRHCHLQCELDHSGESCGHLRDAAIGGEGLTGGHLLLTTYYAPHHSPLTICYSPFTTHRCYLQPTTYNWLESHRWTRCWRRSTMLVF